MVGHGEPLSLMFGSKLGARKNGRLGTRKRADHVSTFELMANSALLYSRADLARALGVSMATVNSIIKDLDLTNYGDRMVKTVAPPEKGKRGRPVDLFGVALHLCTPPREYRSTAERAKDWTRYNRGEFLLTTYRQAYGLTKPGDLGIDNDHESYEKSIRGMEVASDEGDGSDDEISKDSEPVH
jgi:hypothetical protein